MTTLELLKKSSLAPLEAELLLAYVLKKDRVFIISHPEFKVSTKEASTFLKLVKKRKKHWPIAYLIGQKGFYDLTLKVSKEVLIPRPETEIMVEYLSKELNNKKIELIDLGTGSGAIIIALAKNWRDSAKTLRDSTSATFKKINFWGLDIKTPALKIARLNAKKYQLDKTIKFLKSDLLNNFPKNHLRGANLVIAANLPYLTPLEIKQEKSLTHEPKSALVAGKDGLKYYKLLLKYLSSTPFKSLILMMEINPKQNNSLSALVKKYLLNSESQTIKDLRDKKRFVLVKAFPNSKI